MPSVINQCIFKLLKRAEKYQKEHLIKTFVDVGPLLTLLKNPDHQIIYGRRGTGKTHALGYLQGELEAEGHVSIYIDMRNIGSNGGIYSDVKLSISERATRLLIDTFSQVHDGILDYVLKDGSTWDLSIFGPLFDDLAGSISEIEVTGNIEQEEILGGTLSETGNSSINISVKDIGVSAANLSTIGTSQSKRQKISGANRHRVNFTTVNDLFRRIKQQLNDKEIWIIIDEWAEIPYELQPYLADLLRRTILSIRGITVKIGAIEKRANFKLDLDNGYIGVETGADISASINLDEFMVFDNDPEKSKIFFQSLIYRHVNQFLEEAGQPIENKDIFINKAFTQFGAFEELVIASEGIPRDAINILIHAAIKADNDKISIPNIRTAARIWYQQDKEKSVSSNVNARNLLRWIIDEVIGNRSSRAFLLSAEETDEIIEYLFDNRILHLIKQNISSKDSPGLRFNVFAIDFGTYVHLINTANQPKGLYIAESEDNIEGYVEVPINDYRSIRRSILRLTDFYRASEN